MSIKILQFGNAEVISSFTKQFIPDKNHSDEVVQVDNWTLGETPFIVFSIKDKNLIEEQAPSTSALLFFLSSEISLLQEKQFLIDILNSRTQFMGLPLALVFDKSQNLNIKDVINYFELYKMKDRASMIKQINCNQQEQVLQVFKWIESQCQKTGKSSRVFNAQPKVVKMKPKYRESQDEESLKQYEEMVRESQLKGKGVKDQEQIYINRQKEKIKINNMEKQLANFNKNKKKMAPYDIKATPNPKIDPNLHFFLKDPKNEQQQQVNIKIQTDEFKQRPPEKPYLPKKTGINISTQIQENELFDFDKQVKPILNILTTKALELATLEIEEQEEFLKLKKYKQAYNQRLKKQKEHQQKNIDEQLRIIKEKNKLLDENRKKNDNKKKIKERAMCYQLSNQFLSGMYKNAALELYNCNFYANSFDNEIKTTYLDEIFKKSTCFYNQIVQKQTILEGIFEKDCIQPLKEMKKEPQKRIQQLKSKKQLRNQNKAGKKISLHIVYNHEGSYFSNFTRFIDKHFDNTLDDFVKVKEEQLQQLSDKVQAQDMPEEQFIQQKRNQHIQFGKTHINYLLQDEKEICFTTTPNKYEKTSSNNVTNGLLLIDKDGQIIDTIMFGCEHQHNFIRFENNMRDIKQQVNVDQGISVQIDKIPENVKSILSFTKINNVEHFRSEADVKNIKYASYGAQFVQKNIKISSQNFGETVNWSELVKVPQGQQNPQIPSQNLIIVSYILRKRVIPKFWNLQEVNYQSKTMANESEEKQFYESLARFYLKSLDFLKEEEQEEQQSNEPPVSPETEKKNSRTGSRGRSKKVIEEKKKILVLKFTSKILKQITLDLENQSLEEIVTLLNKQVSDWKQFADSCQNGWQLSLKNKPIQSVEFIKKFNKIGDICVKRVPKIEIPPKIAQQEGEQENEENKDQS